MLSIIPTDEILWDHIDYGESHYIGPIKVSLPMNENNTSHIYIVILFPGHTARFPSLG